MLMNGCGEDPGRALAWIAENKSQAMNILIADSGATKCEWCLLYDGKKKKIDTQGISPYFLDSAGIGEVISRELLPGLKKAPVDVVFYYGTGTISPDNRRIVQKAIRQAFP